MILDGLVILTAALLIVSKFLDCYTTDVGMGGSKENISNERNPIGRFLMKMLGVRGAIWGVFAFTVIISVWIAYECITEKHALYTVGFIVLGVVISMMQFDVARCNMNGKRTFFTRGLEKVYRNNN